MVRFFKYLILFCLFLSETTVSAMEASWEQVIQGKVDLNTLFKSIEKELQQQKTVFTPILPQSLHGSMSLITLPELSRPQLMPFEFKVENKQAGDLITTQISNIRIAEFPIVEPNLSRYVNLYDFLALLTSAPKAKKDEAYSGYMESSKELLNTEHVIMGSWFFIPGQDKNTPNYEIGLFTVGNLLTPTPTIMALARKVKAVTDYEGITSVVAFQNNPKPKNISEILAYTRTSISGLVIDWKSRLLKINFFTKSSFVEISAVPFEISPDGILLVSKVLPDGRRLNLRAQFYGDNGLELGGVFTLDSHEHHLIEGSFALSATAIP